MTTNVLHVSYRATEYLVVRAYILTSPLFLSGYGSVKQYHPNYSINDGYEYNRSIPK